jgi:hypothetical protein
MLQNRKVRYCVCMNLTLDRILNQMNPICRSQWPRDLRCGSAAARLVGLWVRIPSGANMSVSCECCVLSEVYVSRWSLIQRSPTGRGASECVREASLMRPWPIRGCCAIGGGGWRWIQFTSHILWAGLSGDRIPMGARFSAPVQTCPGAHPASSTMGTGSFPGVKRLGRGVDHPLYLAPRLKKE